MMNKKTFFILLGLSLLSVLCVVPYVVTLQGDVLKKIGQPLGIIFAAQFAQSIVLFSVTIFFGLLLSKKIGFSPPLFDKGVVKKYAGSSAVWGMICAVSIYLLDTLFTISGAGITTHESYAPVWQKLLAAVYGGVTEEILMRLFLMSLFIWIGMKLGRKTKPTLAMVVVGNILSAVIFGLGHLPLTASLTAITPLIIARAVVLNGVGGVVFGWLYWKRGLEAAMMAHFTTDVFLLSLLPLLFR